MKNKIKIINTYAPHIGFNIEERNNYWEETSNIIKMSIGKTVLYGVLIIMGKYSIMGVGKWTYSTKCERGNGGKFYKIINKYNINVTNAFIFQKIMIK